MSSNRPPNLGKQACGCNRRQLVFSVLVGMRNNLCGYLTCSYCGCANSSVFETDWGTRICCKTTCRDADAQAHIDQLRHEGKLPTSIDESEEKSR